MWLKGLVHTIRDCNGNASQHGHNHIALAVAATCMCAGRDQVVDHLF